MTAQTVAKEVLAEQPSRSWECWERKVCSRRDRFELVATCWRSPALPFQAVQNLPNFSFISNLELQISYHARPSFSQAIAVQIDRLSALSPV